MTRDYGVRKPHRALPIDHLMAGLLGLLLLAGIAGWCWEQQLPSIRTAQAWTIKGPPCPVVSGTARFSYALRDLDTFQFVKTRFSRVYGYVKCMVIFDRGGWTPIPVCQFTVPCCWMSPGLPATPPISPRCTRRPSQLSRAARTVCSARALGLTDL